MIGTQIEGYLIQEKLGEGGMGTVYRALEVNLERLVAIKVLNADVARDPSIGERFRAEARAQAHLSHTNLATLYSFLITQGNAMMVMEYVDGESFQQMVDRRGPIPAQEVIPLFKQALLGLGAAHRVGIVHRDIKPSNIMLNKSGIVKVMDFGIAKAISGSRGLTRTGMQVGTVFYMSPEQVKGERVDLRSDIYALGVTLYEMLTAHVPFSASSDFQVLSDHVNTAPPLPTKFYPYIPKGIENIVLKALEKNPDDRFQTVEEFGAALEHPELWESYAPKSSGVIAEAATPVAAVSDAGKTRLQSSVAIPLGVAAAPAIAGAVPDNAAMGGPEGAAQPVAASAQGESRKPLPIAPKWIAVAAAVLLIAVSALAYKALRPKPAAPVKIASTAAPAPHEASSPGPLVPSATDNPTPADTQPPATAPASGPDTGTPGAQNPAPANTLSNSAANRKRKATQSATATGAPAHEEASTVPAPAPVVVQPAAPAEVTIPAATQVSVRLINAIDGDKAQPGQVFAASVDSAVMVNGQVAVPRFANAQVRLLSAAKAGRFRGNAKLDLALATLTVQGRRYEVESRVYEAESGGRGKRTGKFAGIGGAVGAVVGGIEHGGKGLVEGAAAGGAAGGGAAALTGNRELELPAESRLSFILNAPITVTAGSQ
jgi:predicted Ser/Thr protein kinase